MIHYVIYQFQQNYCRYTSDIVWTEKIFLHAFVQIHFSRLIVFINGPMRTETDTYTPFVMTSIM